MKEIVLKERADTIRVKDVKKKDINYMYLMTDDDEIFKLCITQNGPVMYNFFDIMSQVRYAESTLKLKKLLKSVLEYDNKLFIFENRAEVQKWLIKQFISKLEKEEGYNCINTN